MKPLSLLIVGSMAASVFLGAGCIKRTSPAKLENGFMTPSSGVPSKAYRDSEGNIVVPSTTSGTMMMAPTSSLPSMKPLEIGPDGKGPTSTAPSSH